MMLIIKMNYEGNKIQLRLGDCLEKIKELDDNSIHAVVTDPPYNFEGGFMGEDWDNFGDGKTYQKFCEKWSKECLRVLKPGGHLLAFSSSNQHHRLFTGVEDAGFNIRDTLTWHYGSGFPKGSDIGKYIDRYHTDTYDKRKTTEVINRGDRNKSQSWGGNVGNKKSDIFSPSNDSKTYEKTEAHSNLAKKWEGWRSQLKPASEFIVLAQKPLGEDAIYKNCLEHAVGALHIDACRIPSDEKIPGGGNGTSSNNIKMSSDSRPKVQPHNNGRYPANLILSDGGAKLIDEQSGETKSSITDSLGGYGEGENCYGDCDGVEYERGFNDSGGASRFFTNIPEPAARFKYNAKASKSERTHDDNVENPHPTVKPIEIMSWLIELVTREEQTVLDPFLGSGTTALSALETNRKFVGIEKDEDYLEIAKNRIEFEIE